MLRSMTAYSRVKKVFSNVEVIFEIQAHNKRHLDVHLKLPVEFHALDAAIRKKVSQTISRGSITITVQAHFLTEHTAQVQLNVPLAKKIDQAITELASALGMETLSPSERLLRVLAEKGILQLGAQVTDESIYHNEILNALDTALGKLIAMKEDEGQALVLEFESRLSILDVLVQRIMELAQSYPEKHFFKMKELFQKLFEQSELFASDRVGEGKGTQVLKEMAMKEIALLAEKTDITEEIVRFLHHLSHFRLLLKSEEQGIGKTLEFVLQEMQREVNTIGAKSQDVTVSQLVITCKSEIEKIREQVQNVE